MGARIGQRHARGCDCNQPIIQNEFERTMESKMKITKQANRATRTFTIVIEVEQSELRKYKNLLEVLAAAAQELEKANVQD
jgi:hypothetical protein